jgi:hypothetical protein
MGRLDLPDPRRDEDDERRRNGDPLAFARPFMGMGSATAVSISTECGECGEYGGVHLGTCSRSMMRGGATS